MRQRERGEGGRERGGERQTDRHKHTERKGRAGGRREREEEGVGRLWPERTQED